MHGCMPFSLGMPNQRSTPLIEAVNFERVQLFHLVDHRMVTLGFSSKATDRIRKDLGTVPRGCPKSVWDHPTG